MKQILRFPIKFVAEQTIEIPVGSIIRSAIVVDNILNIYVECVPGVKYTDNYVVYLVATGVALPEVPSTEFLGTVIKPTPNDKGAYVFHVYAKRNI